MWLCYIDNDGCRTAVHLGEETVSIKRTVSGWKVVCKEYARGFTNQPALTDNYDSVAKFLGLKMIKEL